MFRLSDNVHMPHADPLVNILSPATLYYGISFCCCLKTGVPTPNLSGDLECYCLVVVDNKYQTERMDH